MVEDLAKGSVDVTEVRSEDERADGVVARKKHVHGSPAARIMPLGGTARDLHGLVI